MKIPPVKCEGVSPRCWIRLTYRPSAAAFVWFQSSERGGALVRSHERCQALAHVAVCAAFAASKGVRAAAAAFALTCRRQSSAVKGLVFSL